MRIYTPAASHDRAYGSTFRLVAIEFWCNLFRDVHRHHILNTEKQVLWVMVNSEQSSQFAKAALLQMRCVGRQYREVVALDGVDSRGSKHGLVAANTAAST